MMFTDLLRRCNPDVPSYILKFPKDVQRAEELTGGDPNIIYDPKFQPEEKTDYREHFGLKPLKKSLSEKVEPKKRLSLPNMKSSVRRSCVTRPLHRTSEHRFSPFSRSVTNKARNYEEKRSTNVTRSGLIKMIRIQNCSSSEEKYFVNYMTCYLCPFTCERIDVIIRHHRSHYRGELKPYPSHVPAQYKLEFNENIVKYKDKPVRYFTSTPKGKTEKSIKRKLLDDPTTPIKKKKTESNKKEKNNTASATTSSNVSGPEGLTKKRKKGKRSKEDVLNLSESFREDILKDWDDDEDDTEVKKTRTEEKEESTSHDNDLPSTSGINTSENKLTPEKSCFDFDEESDESIMDTTLKFGQKLPRVINEEKRSKSSSNKEVKRNEEILMDVDKVLEETEIPDLPEVPDIIFDKKNKIEEVKGSYKKPVEGSSVLEIPESSAVKDIEASSEEDVREVNTLKDITEANTVEDITESSTKDVIKDNTVEGITEANTEDDVTKSTNIAEDITEANTEDDDVTKTSTVENITEYDVIKANTSEDITEGHTEDDVTKSTNILEDITEAGKHASEVNAIEDVTTKANILKDITEEDIAAINTMGDITDASSSVVEITEAKTEEDFTKLNAMEDVNETNTEEDISEANVELLSIPFTSVPEDNILNSAGDNNTQHDDNDDFNKLEVQSRDHQNANIYTSETIEDNGKKIEFSDSISLETLQYTADEKKQDTHFIVNIQTEDCTATIPSKEYDLEKYSNDVYNNENTFGEKFEKSVENVKSNESESIRRETITGSFKENYNVLDDPTEIEKSSTKIEEKTTELNFKNSTEQGFSDKCEINEEMESILEIEEENSSCEDSQQKMEMGKHEDSSVISNRGKYDNPLQLHSEERKELIEVKEDEYVKDNSERVQNDDHTRNGINYEIDQALPDYISEQGEEKRLIEEYISKDITQMEGTDTQPKDQIETNENDTSQLEENDSSSSNDKAKNSFTESKMEEKKVEADKMSLEDNNDGVSSDDEIKMETKNLARTSKPEEDLHVDKVVPILSETIEQNEEILDTESEMPTNFRFETELGMKIEIGNPDDEKKEESSKLISEVQDALISDISVKNNSSIVTEMEQEEANEEIFHNKDNFRIETNNEITTNISEGLKFEMKISDKDGKSSRIDIRQEENTYVKDNKIKVNLTMVDKVDTLYKSDNTTVKSSEVVTKTKRTEGSDSGSDLDMDESIMKECKPLTVDSIKRCEPSVLENKTDPPEKSKRFTRKRIDFVKLYTKKQDSVETTPEILGENIELEKPADNNVSLAIQIQNLDINNMPIVYGNDEGTISTNVSEIKDVRDHYGPPPKGARIVDVRFLNQFEPEDLSPNKVLFTMPSKEEFEELDKRRAAAAALKTTSKTISKSQTSQSVPVVVSSGQSNIVIKKDIAPKVTVGSKVQVISRGNQGAKLLLITPSGGNKVMIPAQQLSGSTLVPSKIVSAGGKVSTLSKLPPGTRLITTTGSNPKISGTNKIFTSRNIPTTSKVIRSQPAGVQHNLQHAKIIKPAGSRNVITELRAGPSDVSQLRKIDVQPSTSGVIAKSEVKSNMSYSRQFQKEGTKNIIKKQACPNILQKNQKRIYRPPVSSKPPLVTSVTMAEQSPTEVDMKTVSNETIEIIVRMDDKGNCHSVSPIIEQVSDDQNIITETPTTAEMDKIIFLDANTENFSNIQQTIITKPSQDILAKALADTQVFQTDSAEMEETVLLEQQYPNHPTLTHNVLETSLTLNQPIMTPLEVPSSVTQQSAFRHGRRKSEVQPSMPLLTDEVDISSSPIFINAANLSTSTAPVSFQIIDDSNIVVASSNSAPSASTLDSRLVYTPELITTTHVTKNSGEFQYINPGPSTESKEENVLPEFFKGNFGKRTKHDPKRRKRKDDL